jgi:hypothetical protein
VTRTSVEYKGIPICNDLRPRLQPSLVLSSISVRESEVRNVPRGHIGPCGQARCSMTVNIPTRSDSKDTFV